MLSNMRKEFKAMRWDPLCCDFGSIKMRFEENKAALRRKGINFATFDTMYRRAACENITECWLTTRKIERGELRDCSVVAAEDEAPVEEGVFVLPRF